MEKSSLLVGWLLSFFALLFLSFIGGVGLRLAFGETAGMVLGIVLGLVLGLTHVVIWRKIVRRHVG